MYPIIFRIGGGSCIRKHLKMSNMFIFLHVAPTALVFLSCYVKKNLTKLVLLNRSTFRQDLRKYVIMANRE